MNGLRLTVLFDGLCGFVPEEVAGKPVAMTVLLTDARKPVAVSVTPHSGVKLMHVSHSPAIAVRISDVDFASTTQPLVVTSDPGVAEWRLDGDDITIVAGHTSRVADPAFSIDRTSGSLSNFGLIPDFGLEARESCITNPDPAKEGLACRLRIDAGRMSSEPSSVTTDSYAFVPMSAITKQDPKPTLKNPPQRIRVATLARYELTVESGSDASSSSVEIVSATRGTKLVLRSSFGRNVEIVVRNAPSPGSKPPTNFGPSKDCFIDVDYELSYRVAEAWPKVDPLVPAVVVPKVHTFPERPCTGKTFRARRLTAS